MTIKNMTTIKFSGVGFVVASLLSFTSVNASEMPKGNFEKYEVIVSNVPKNAQPVLRMDAKNMAETWSSADFKLEDGVYSTGKYASSVTLSSMSPEISLPQATGDEHIYLQLDHKFDTERNYDYIKVLYSENGGEYKRIMRRTGATNFYYDYIDLTSLAGKTVNFKFELSSDESNEGNGWSINAVSLVKGEKSSYTGTPKSVLRSTPSDDDLDITSISSTVKSLKLLGFAESDLPNKLSVYFSARDLNQRFVDMLKVSDLQVKWGGAIVDNSCLQMAKLTENSRLPVDIAFLIDNSESMFEEIKGVRDNVLDLVTKFTQLNCRIGTYSYGDTWEACDKQMQYIYGSGDFYGDLKKIENRNSFTRLWESFNANTGDLEPYYEILYDMINKRDLNYRSNSQKVLILIGDESAVGQGNNMGCEKNKIYSIYEDKQKIVDALHGDGFQLFTIVDNNNYYDANYGVESFTGMAVGTGGTDIDIENYVDFTEIFTKISQNLVERYVLTIDLSKCELPIDGTIQIKVGDEESEIITPNVKQQGRIVRTDKTMAYDKNAISLLDANTTEVGAYVANLPDGVSVKKMHIYVKLDGDNDYIEINADDVAWSVDGWYGKVPADMITENAVINYRFRAELSNGDYVLSSPEGTEPYDYWTITVLPNTPPNIDENVSVTKGALCQSTIVSATITDNGSVADAQIWYHKIGDVSDYKPAPYSSKNGDTYYFEIPSSVASAPGFEYLISATDDLGAVSWFGTSETKERANRFEIEEKIPTELSRKKEGNTISPSVNDDCIHYLANDELYLYFDNGCESDILMATATVSSNWVYPYVKIPTNTSTNGIKNGVEEGDPIKVKLKRENEWFEVSTENTKYIKDNPIYIELPSTPSFKVYSSDDIELHNGQTEVSTWDKTDFGYANSSKTYNYTIKNFSGCGDVEFVGSIIKYDDPSSDGSFQLNGINDGEVINNWSEGGFNIVYNGQKNADATITLRYNDPRNNTTQDFTFKVSGKNMPENETCEGVSIVNDKYNHGVFVNVTEHNSMLYIYMVDVTGKYVDELYHRNNIHAGLSYFPCPSNLKAGSYYIVIEREGKPTCSNFISIE